MSMIKNVVSASSLSFAHAVNQLELSLTNEDRLRLEVYRVCELQHDLVMANEFRHRTQGLFSVFGWYYPFTSDNVDEVFDSGFAPPRKYRFGAHFAHSSHIRGTIMKLLLSTVCVGRSVVCRGEQEALSLREIPDGYHSIYISPNETDSAMFTDVYLLHSGSLAVPTHIIEFLFRDTTKLEVNSKIFRDHSPEHELSLLLHNVRTLLQSQLATSEQDLERFSHAVISKSDSVKQELHELLEDYLRSVNNREQHHFELQRSMKDVDSLLDLLAFVSSNGSSASSADPISTFALLKNHIEEQVSTLQVDTLPSVITSNDKQIDALKQQLEQKDVLIARMQEDICNLQNQLR